MPLNQNQFDRFRILHPLLKRRTGVTLNEYGEACRTQLLLNDSPSVRTLKYDIEKLRKHFHAPIVCKNYRYQYTRDDFSLYEVLSPDDYMLRRQMEDLLGKLAHIPVIKGLEDFHVKFRELRSQKKLIQLQEVNQYTGIGHLPELYQALLDKQCLNITYCDFGSSQTTHILSPYILREYHNRWYIFGWEHDLNKIHKLALDRIQKIKPSLFPFLPDKGDVQSYLSDLIGVTRSTGDEPQEVRIRVKKSRAYYLLTKPLHVSQHYKPDPTDNSFGIFSFRLILNKELTTTLLSLGTDAEVLAPAELRREIADCAREMWERYGSQVGSVSLA